MISILVIITICIVVFIAKLITLIDMLYRHKLLEDNFFLVRLLRPIPKSAPDASLKPSTHEGYHLSVTMNKFPQYVVAF